MKQRKKKAIVVVCLLGNAFTMSGCGRQVEAKRKEMDIAVHSSLPLQADIYFKNASAKEEVKVVKSDLDVQTLGSYRVWMEYERQKVCMKIHVVDKEAPKLKLVQTSFTFPLGTSLDAVNEAIRKKVIITDNYDTAFTEWKPLTKLPKKAQTMEVTLQVEDQSHNLSDKAIIHVHFTKQNQKQTVTVAHSKQRIQAKQQTESQTQTGTEKKKQDESAKAPIDKSSQKETAVTTTPPKEKPRLSVANFPPYLLGNSGRVFASYAQAEVWAKEQIKIEGGPWFGYYMEIGQPFDGDYANAGEEDTPWTVDFFR